MSRRQNWCDSPFLFGKSGRRHFKNSSQGPGGHDIIQGIEQIGIVNGKTKVILGFGSVEKPTFYAETTSKGHDKRHKKHADDMGITFKQWLNEAADLLNAYAGEDYLDWYEPGDRLFYRFDTKKSRIVIGTENQSINTYFALPKSSYKNYLPDLV